MAYTRINWQDAPSTATPRNAENLNIMDKGISDLFEMIYPINIVVPFYDDIDRSTWLDYTWEKVAIGKTLVGQDIHQTEFDTIGKTGGSKELQEHKHNILTQTGGNASGWGGTGLARANTGYTQDFSDFMSNTGTGDSGNLQPYEVVTYWRRVA